MNAEPPQPPSRDDISHQANTWFALLQGGMATPAEREQLARWLAADPRHAAAYARLEQLWAASALALAPRQPVSSRQWSRRRFVGLGMAAGAAAVAVGAGNFWLNGGGAPFADLRTAVGERRTVQLADGSMVEIAGNSALNVDFSSDHRSVELLHGEAFFKVPPSAAGEFKVRTAAGQVAASDADFCLACEGPNATLTVARRSVRVLAANQQTELDEGLAMAFSTTHAGPIQRADLAQVLAWRSGRLVFFDKPLLAVVNELERWRPGKIFIPDPQLAARRVSLILNLDKPEQMLDVLAKALAIRTRHYTDLITIIQPA